MVLHCPVQGKNGFCIWWCYPVLRGANQCGGKMVAKLKGVLLASLLAVDYTEKAIVKSEWLSRQSV
jgi:hypothetical protein